jgi:hypothetical protein
MQLKLAEHILADGRLEAELQCREEQRWLAVDDTGATLLLGLLGRLQAELDRAEMAGGIEPDSTEVTEAIAKFEEMIAEVNELLEKLEVMAAREEDEAAETERSCAMHSAVRPEPKVERLPSSPKPSPASPRVHRARGNAAAVPAAMDDGWKFGIVKFFDKIGWSGLINITTATAVIEIPISLGAFRKSGLNNLFAGEHIECLVVTRPDGRKEATEIAARKVARHQT